MQECKNIGIATYSFDLFFNILYNKNIGKKRKVGFRGDVSRIKF